MPRRRLRNKDTQEAWGREGTPGSRRVAGADEDAFSMGVQAALQALAGADPSAIDCLLFATTTAPFSERSSAALLAETLGLGPNTLCLDIGSSIRAGTAAMQVAISMIEGGSARQALVVAADKRLPRPGAPEERLVGHAGAAIWLGPARGCVAEVLGRVNIVGSRFDPWRLPNERFARRGDARFALEGYAAFMGAALSQILEQQGLAPADFKQVALMSPDAAGGSRVLAKSGFDPKAQACDLSHETGLTGAAHPFLMLVGALEAAAAGERILLLGYGDGADATALRLAKASGSRLLQEAIARGYDISYNHYLRLNSLHAGSGDDTAGFASETMLERDKALWQRLEGRRCGGCGAVVSLPLPSCPRCAKRGGFEPQRLRRAGVLFAVTHEHYFPTPEPPLGMAIVDLDGGGRLCLQVADEGVPLKVGGSVELVLRRLHNAGHMPHYFWKCRSHSPPPRSCE